MSCCLPDVCPNFAIDSPSFQNVAHLCMQAYWTLSEATRSVHWAPAIRPLRLPGPGPVLQAKANFSRTKAPLSGSWNQQARNVHLPQFNSLGWGPASALT